MRKKADQTRSMIHIPWWQAVQKPGGGIRSVAKLSGHGGFTLIEMLLVVTIIAVLVAISIPMVAGRLERVRVVTDAANERTARSAAMAEYLTEGTFGEQPCGSNSVVAYYDAAKGKWVKDKSTIEGYGKCITTHGHADDILEAIWNPSDGRVYLKWWRDNDGGSQDEVEPMSLQSNLFQPYNGGSRTAQLPTPGLCSVSGCSHTNQETIVRKTAGNIPLVQSICKDCGQWISKDQDYSN